jgi:hypothetical protein
MSAEKNRIDNLTSKQKDYAVFLPALSSFYGTYVGKQRHDPNYVDAQRMPAKFENGMEGLNWLNPNKGYFPYKWALYSAGHANLDVNKQDPKEDMVRNRDPNSFVLGDSGGFQIGKGVWEGNWKDPNCPKAQKKREQVLTWMDAYMDRGMILDIPAWVARSPAGQKATGISTYQEAVQGTYINNDYFMKHRTGQCKFLNVLQGENHTEADDWYEQMKKYCDPKQYSQPFNGWAMGGQNMCDVHLLLRRLVALRFDGLLEPGLHDWMHFLGTSKLEWATLLTDVQRAIRKYHNENFTISFDCASPFLATANGQIYYDVVTPDRKKWSYQMQASVDDKKYSIDNRGFRDAVLQDKVFDTFLESPVSERLTINDVCHYKPGDLNKIGKEGKTSWDSFSYTLQMGHNVWTHIHAVQEANRQYDAGKYPEMLVASTGDKKNFRSYDRAFFRDIVNDIFATSNRGKAEEIIEHYNKYWMSIVGTRGAVGKKTVNAGTMFNTLFDVEESNAVEQQTANNGLDENKLNQHEDDENV